MRTAQIADNHRRFHATRTIALHPAKTGERIAIQLLGKILNHVVTFGFAVYQHVQPEVFLHLDGVTNLTVHGFDVFGLTQLALLVGLTRKADRRSLRE